MTSLEAVLGLAAFLCALVSGLLFAFAVVVMPGIRRLDDGSFIRAFQAIDRVIQNNQPLFMLVWVGSALALLAAAVVGVRVLSGTDRLLLIVSTAVYFLCVQLPTLAVNVPLNNQLQRFDVEVMNDAARRRARDEFEPRWNRWNTLRTACGSIVVVLLLVLLIRL